MSSTRHAPDNSPLNQERYMSSPEYAELRGVNGIAATAKAALITSAKKRSLIFFLQALSLEAGGLRTTVAEKIYDMFPERVGTPSMIRAKVRAGETITDAQVEEILDETERGSLQNLNFDETSHERPERLEQRKRDVAQASHEASYYLKRLQRPEKLAAFLVDLCINPRLLLSDPNEGSKSDGATRDAEIKRFVEQHSDLHKYHFKAADFDDFHDICSALFEFQIRCSKVAAESVAKTVVTRKVHQTLDACLASRRMVLIEGESDAGKSTSGEAWCAMHKGEARFVRLQGITNKTVFFRALSKSLGIASSYSRTSTEMEARVADMLQRSGLMLVLDESQYTFVQGERIRSRPELVDWIQTALLNHGVPVALIASPLFSKRLHQAERHTIWNSDQWRRRIYRHVVLPVIPTRDDIELVVKHHLPGVDAASLKYLAGYASTCIITRKEPRTKKEQKVSFAFTAITDTLADAIQIANAAGRTRITLQDLKEAVATFRSASELEKHRAFDSPQKDDTERAAKSLQPSCSEDAGEPQPRAQEREKDFTGRNRPVAALEMPGTRETAPALSDA